MTLSHKGDSEVEITIELDLTGAGLWVLWKSITVPAGVNITHDFPVELQARWMRVTANKACVASAQLAY
jgi:hypothetical protein